MEFTTFQLVTEWDKLNIGEMLDQISLECTSPESSSKAVISKLRASSKYEVVSQRTKFTFVGFVPAMVQEERNKLQ